MSTLNALLPGAIPDWMQDGLCRQVDADTFYPGKGDRPAVALAKSVCGRCDVRKQCLQYALDTGEPWGIWGGLTEKERRRHAVTQAVMAA